MQKATNFVIVDPSLRSSGVLVVNGINVRHYAIQTPKKVGRLEILGNLSKHFTELAQSNNWDFLAIENYTFKQPKSSAVTVQAEVGGIIRGCFGAEGVPIIEINCQTWKAVTGIRLPKGTKADNSNYIYAVAKKYDFICQTTDECDTYLMWQTLKKISDGSTDKGDELRKQIREMEIEI